MAIQMEPAGMLRRLGAIVYDSLVVAAILMIATAVVMPFTGGEAVPPGTIWFELYLGTWLLLYFAGSWAIGGQTVGDRAWRLHVRDGEGRYPSWGRCILRALLAVPSLGIFGLGLIWCWFDPEGHSLHDRGAKTQLLFEPKVGK